MKQNEFNELSEVNEFEFIFQEVKGLFGSVNWGVEFLFQAEQQEVNSAFPPSFCLFSSPMASRIPRYKKNLENQTLSKASSSNRIL